MEDSQTVVADRVGHIVSELAQLALRWPDIRIKGWPNSCILVIHPVAVV